MRRLWLSMVAMACAAAPALAQPNYAAAERVEMTVEPAPLPEPALRDRLLPGLADQTPGNAATVYLSAFELADHISHDVWVDEDALESASPADLPAEKAAALIKAYRDPLDQCEIAAGRSYCTWDSTVRERGLAALLAYLNTSRTMANVLSIKAKLEIKQRQYDAAVRTIRTGMALAHDVGQEPILVQLLVSAGIQSLMFHDLRYLAQAPGAPNLYWPLAALPTAAEQRVQMVQVERAMPYFTYPELRHAQTLSAEESRRIVQGIMQYVAPNRGGEGAELILGMIAAYPHAKQYLTDHQMPAATVESMPANSAVLAWWFYEYEAHNDQVEKWAALPIWEAYAGITREVRSWNRASDPANPWLRVMPRYDDAIGSLARLEREKDVAQTIEAIRAYAAGHEGALPPSLSDLAPETPAPLDALLGKPFEYTASGRSATLRAAALPGATRSAETNYVITLAGSTKARGS